MKKSRKKLPYEEGTWFAVPVQPNGYCVGVVSRMAGDGAIFGYFFGPKRESVPKLKDLDGLSPGRAIWLGQFGDLGLLEEKWHVIGKMPHWRRESWPLPPFIRVDDVSGDAMKVVYSDENLDLVSEEPCDPALARIYPKDAAAGYGAVEIRLSNILGGKEASRMKSQRKNRTRRSYGKSQR